MSDAEELLRGAGLNPAPAPEFRTVPWPGDSNRVRYAVFAQHRMWGYYSPDPDAPGLYGATRQIGMRDTGEYAVFDDEQAARDWLIEWAEQNRG